MESNKYGMLLNTNIKLHRSYFNEMCKLIGINVIYKAPRRDKHYNTQGELISAYQEPLITGCIFEEHPTQKTMRLLGWNSDSQDSISVIHVAYDLPDLQQGALFIIPSGIDNTAGRVFRVVEMSVEMIYPSSISCKLVPEYANNFEKTLLDYSQSNFNLLANEGGEEDNLL